MNSDFSLESFRVFEAVVINVGCQGSGRHNILSCN